MSKKKKKKYKLDQLNKKQILLLEKRPDVAHLYPAEDIKQR